MIKPALRAPLALLLCALAMGWGPPAFAQSSVSSHRVDHRGTPLDTVLDGITAGTTLDPTLAGLAALTVASGKLIYSTGTDTFSTSTISSGARTLLADTTVPRLPAANIWAGAATFNALTEIASNQPQLRWTEQDQTDPAGSFRMYVNTDRFNFERAASAAWATNSPIFTVTGSTRVLDFAVTPTVAGSAVVTAGGVGSSVEAWDADLDALAAPTYAADTIPYFTAVHTASTTPLTATGRSILDDTSTSAVRTTLGLAIGTDVEAYNANLAAIAGQTTAADKLIYWTGSGAASTTPFTAAGRALVDDADATAQRTTLGLGTAATVNTGTSGATIPLLSAANTWTLNQSIPGAIVFAAAGTSRNVEFRSGATAAGERWSSGANATAEGGSNAGSDYNLAAYGDTGSFLGFALTCTRSTRVCNFPVAPTFTDPATTRSNLGLSIGTSTEAWDADLDALAALTGNGIPAQTGAGTWALRTMAAPAAGLTIANPGGVAGAPTFALANDLAGVEGLAANGLAARTATDTWAVRTITAPAAGVTVSNGDGVSGNPTLALANDLSAVEALSTTGIAVRTATDTWTTRTIGSGTGITVTNGDGVAGAPSIAINAATTPQLGTTNTFALAQTFTVAPVFTDASGTRTALGLTTAATTALGTSGATIPLNSTANTFAAAQTFTLAPVFTDGSGSRTALGLAIGTNVQAWDADLDAVAALTSPATKITGALQSASNLSDVASAPTARTNLGIYIGQTVTLVDVNNTAFTFGTDGPTIYHNGPVTGNRNLNALIGSGTTGSRMRFVRSANSTGAFNLNVRDSVSATTLKALTGPSTWCDIEWNGTAFVLTASGTL